MMYYQKLCPTMLYNISEIQSGIGRPEITIPSGSKKKGAKTARKSILRKISRLITLINHLVYSRFLSDIVRGTQLYRLRY